MGMRLVREHGGLTCAGSATLFYFRLFSLLIGSFLYLVVHFRPTSFRMGEFLLYVAYKKPARLFGWIVH